MSTTVLLADTQGVFRRGVRVVLERDGEFAVVAETGRGSEVLPLVQRYTPQLVLLDVQLPDVDGYRCLEALKRRYPAVKTVVLTEAGAQDDVREALRRGARGYILKSLDATDLPDALRRTITAPVPWPMGAAAVDRDAADLGLTEREASILRGVARGLTNRAVAGELAISELTVKFHLTNIYRKLGAPNRTAAARAALTLGVVDVLGAGESPAPPQTPPGL